MNSCADMKSQVKLCEPTRGRWHEKEEARATTLQDHYITEMSHMLHCYGFSVEQLIISVRSSNL